MPITSIGSYSSTTAEFEINWEQADAEIAPATLTLAANYTRANFVAERTALLTSINLVPMLADDARFAAANRDNARLALLVRANQFRGAVLSKITDEIYRQHLPTVPKISSDLSKFTEPLHAMNTMWERINGHGVELELSGPLTLQGDYTEAMFAADIENLSVLTNAAAKSDSNIGFARTTRDTLMAAIYDRLKQYRAAAEADLPANSPALANLPRLSPKPGTTPPTLGATGDWNAATAMADLSWETAKAKAVAKIQVRGCVGAAYKDADEEIVADLLPDATSWSGDWGLTAPGSLASFKAYVMTDDGNENGGKAVKIMRPALP